MNFNFETQTTDPILNLKKDQILDLSKHAPALRKAVLAGGWDVAVRGASADLDIAAFLLDATGHIKTSIDVIFFNNKVGTGIQLEGDNLTGEGDGDDERIDIDLDKIPESYQKIVFAIVIFDAQAKHQSFGMIRNAYVRLLDANNGENEICRYNLSEDYSTDTAVIACSLNRTDYGWEMEAIGDGLIGDLNTIAARLKK